MPVIYQFILTFFFVLSLTLHAQACPKKGNFTVKIRAGYMDVNDSIKNSSNGTQATQKFKNGPIFETGIGYFFTDNIAAEIAAGYGLSKYQTLSNTTKDVNLVPITATAQLHLPIYNQLVPYIGGGYSYTVVFNEPTNVKIKDAGNAVIQAGINLYILEHLFNDGNFHNVGINIDGKYFLKTKNDITEQQETFKNELSRFTVMAGINIIF